MLLQVNIMMLGAAFIKINEQIKIIIQERGDSYKAVEILHNTGN